MRFAWIFVAAALAAQEAGPDYAALSRGYEALRGKNYDAAVAAFGEAMRLDPLRVATHKDLAYTYLKIGENEAAREQFEEAMRLDPGDLHVALEFAFLSFEAREQPMQAKAVARRIFDRVRSQREDAEAQATAEKAFRNIDEPLAAGIARWKAALASAPETFSAHYELAQLAEQRDELGLAADEYRAAWKILPERRRVLLDLGRVLKAAERPEDAMAALLAASRGGEPRAAEMARELLPVRYPYVYEFRNALALDPANVELHRELAYLLLSMNQRAEAEVEFRSITESAPDDLLSAAQLGFLYLSRHEEALAKPLFDRVLRGDNDELANRVRTALHMPVKLQQTGRPVEAEASARVMGERSLKAGYLRDALKYLSVAEEEDPGDKSVALKLGWVYNLLHDDRTALHWFDLARTSPDAAVSSEAQKAYSALRPEFARVRTTFWLFPFYSSRWDDTFSYGQIKTEFRFEGWPVRPYLSTRFIGDTRQTLPGPAGPQSLSESSFIFAAGVTGTWHRVTAWAEAGSAVSYAKGQALPDYRGGLAWARGWGHLMSSETPGWFVETNADEVFVSRFQNDWLTYSQTRAGYTIRPVQLLINANATFDVKRQYWANYAEAGPGVRFHVPNTPESLLFSVSAMRGVYLVNAGNPRRPNFFDFRAGLWYAFTH